MDADEVMTMAEGSLTIKESWKLYRMLRARVELIPPDVAQDMKEREPELFWPVQFDAQGWLIFPWQEGYIPPPAEPPQAAEGKAEKVH